MAIDFPASPTNGQTFTSGTVTYTWDGTKWTAVAAAGSSNSITQGNTNATVTDTGSDGRFVVTTEGSERLRVDSSGRLGIATTSPSETLHVNGNARASHFLSQGWFVGQGNLTTADARSGVTGIGPSSSSSPGDFFGAYAWFYGAAHNTRPGDIEIGTGLNTNGSIQFRINNTERMRIASSGAVAVNTTTPSARFHINGIGGTNNHSLWVTGWGSGIGAAATFKADNTSNADVIYFETSAAQVGKIAITSTSTSYNTSSDYRLKENVTPVTDGITRLQQLKPSRFNFIADPDKTVDGFLAHEAADVVPECVTGEKDAVDADGNPVYQGIDQSKLVPLLTAALQEAIGRIETLEAKVAALESPTTALEIPVDPSSTDT